MSSDSQPAPHDQPSPETWVRLITDQLPAVLWTTDLDLRFTLSTGAGLARLKLKPGEAVGQLLPEFIGSSDPKSPVIDAHLKALSGESAVYEHHFGGNAYHCNVEPLRGKNDQIVGCIGFALDVTGEHEAEERSRKHEAKLAEQFAELDLIYRTAPVGLCLLDLELRYVRINEHLARINRLPVAEHIGKRLQDVLPDLAEKIEPNYRQVIKSGYPILNLELRGPHPADQDNEGYWRTSYYPVKNDQGDITGVSAVVQDVSEQRRAGERLRASRELLETRVEQRTQELTSTNVKLQAEITERRKSSEQIRELNAKLDQTARLTVMGEMTAGLAHELHQPLAVIANYANGCIRRIEEKQVPSVELLDAMEKMKSEALRAGEILRRTRDFLKQRTTSWSDVNIEDVIRSSVQLAGFSRHQRDVKIQIDANGELPPLFGDGIQLTQALLNIVLNGIEAMESVPKAERRLDIQGRLIGMSIEIAIKDNGPGIPQSELATIFDQFVTTKQEGLGMGLSISRSIIEAHGGKLTATQNPDRGLTFLITLPTMQNLLNDSNPNL